MGGFGPQNQSRISAPRRRQGPAAIHRFMLGCRQVVHGRMTIAENSILAGEWQMRLIDEAVRGFEIECETNDFVAR